jgi:hypothetical protein
MAATVYIKRRFGWNPLIATRAAHSCYIPLKASNCRHLVGIFVEHINLLACSELMTTVQDVARWMLQEIERHGRLYQENAAIDIDKNFGSEFAPISENGNLVIRQDVLREFRKLTESEVVWDKTERMWRKRDRRDTPGKRTADY